jgi:hypothetical protein
MVINTNNLEETIFIIMDKDEPMLLGSCSSDGFRDNIHEKIWEKSHKKAKKDNISLLKALRIEIKRAGFVPEEVKH